MADTFKGIITADGKKRQLPYRNVIETPVSDETLSIQGAFADSKAVGDRFKEVNAETDSLKEDIGNILKKEKINIANMYIKGIIKSNGEIGIYKDGFTSNIIPKFLIVVPSTTIEASYSITTKNILWIYEYDKNKAFIKITKGTSNTMLTSKTHFVIFEHSGWDGEDVYVSYICKDVNNKWECRKRVNDKTIPFAYRVNPTYYTDVSDNITTLTEKNVFTSGILMLPPNYSENGEKVPLIYFSHGSADYYNITTTDFPSHYMDYIKYLCDEGYAIFDCYGWTNMYTTSGAQMGNPTNMCAIRQGIEYVCRYYNVDINSIYVTGKSLGGLQAINMCYEHGLNVKACCPIAPELDMTSIGFGYDVNCRKSFAKDLHFEPINSPVLDEEGSKSLAAFTTQFKEYAKSNANKLLGYNPLWRGLIGANAEELIQFQIDGQDGRFEDNKGLPNKIKTMTRICNVPTKIICAIDDKAVSHDLCKAYLQSLKNGGCVGEMRSLPSGTGGHHAVDNDENALKVESITTKCGIVHIDVPLAYAEMVQFFKRYS